MNELWIVQKQAVDYDEYPVGSPSEKVGPFDTWRQAQDYIDEVYPMTPGTFKRRGVGNREIVQAVNLLSWVRSPEEGRKRAGM